MFLKWTEAKWLFTYVIQIFVLHDNANSLLLQYYCCMFLKPHISFEMLLETCVLIWNFHKVELQHLETHDVHFYRSWNSNICLETCFHILTCSRMNVSWVLAWKINSLTMMVPKGFSTSSHVQGWRFHES